MTAPKPPGEHRRRGRPPVTDPELIRRPVPVRLSPREQESIRAAANGAPLGTAVREVALRATVTIADARLDKEAMALALFRVIAAVDEAARRFSGDPAALAVLHPLMDETALAREKLAGSIVGKVLP